MTKFKYDLTLEDATDIQFTNLAGANTGKVESDGNDLVLSNAVGDVLIGDGSSDVYIGDGTNNVDILFEKSGNIKAEDGSSGVTLTLGSSDTTLAIESPTLNTFDTSGVSTFSGAVNVGVDDTGHDVKFFGATTGASMLWDESEDGLLITHPPDDAGLEIYTVSGAAMTTPQFKVGRNVNEWVGIYTEDRTAHVIHRQDETDSDPMNTSFELWGGGSGNDNWVWRHGTNTGGSLATVMTLDKAGQLTLTGALDVAGDTTITNGLHVHHDEGIELRATGAGSTTVTTLTSYASGGNSRIEIKGGNYVHSTVFQTTWNDFEYAKILSSYNTSDSSFVLNKSASDGSVAASTTISTGASNFNGTIASGAITSTGNIRLPNSGKLYTWTGHDANFLDYNNWVASAAGGMTINNVSSTGEIYLKSGNALALTLDENQAATFAGTIGSGAITSTGKITGTELEGTSLDINGNADISGTLDMSGNINLNSGADIILEADNVGGGGASSIQYPDAAGTNRIMLAADSDVVILSNRAANGTVQIRANTATAGGGSNEITVVTVEDDKVTISQDLDVTGNVLPGITIIKILPRDFIADDGGRPVQIDNTGSDRWIESDSTSPLYASVEIPPGFKATHVDIYGSATSAVTVYEADINVRTVTSKGTGNIGTQINITDVTSDATNYLLIELAQASGEQVNGGKVTIAKV